MPSYDADKDATLHEPLSFTAKGVKYDVLELTDEMLDEIKACSPDENELKDQRVGDMLSMQLSIMTGKPAEEFSGLSLRERGGIVKWVSSAMLDLGGVKAKNVRAR